MIKIVAINSKYVHTLLSPYYLKENSEYKDIQIIQTNVNVNINEIVRIALVDSPIAIAFPSYIFNINIVSIVAKIIKDISPDTLIILGGPEVSFEYTEHLEYCDYIITGEGELSFGILAAKIAKGVLSDSVVIGVAMDIANIISPYSEDYFSDTKGKIAYFEASRGCPYNCAYCMSGVSKLRFFGIERTIDDLVKFRGRDIRVLKFVDRTFNANITFAKQIMRYLIINKEHYDFGFHFEIAGDLIDDEFIEIVASAPNGLFQFEIGVQSFNEETLKSVIRKTDIDDVISNISRLIDCGNAHVHTDLIAGLPFEGLESFKNGFDRLYNIGSNMLQLGFLKVLKGSRIKEMMVDGYEFNSTPPYEIIYTPYLSIGEIAELKLVEDAVEKYANGGIFSKTLTRYIVGSPYEFYRILGARSIGISELFTRIQVLYDMLSESNNPSIVRDIMLLDYMSNNNSRVLPPVLKIAYDKSFAKMLREQKIDKKQYFAALININPYSGEFEKNIVYCDYRKGYELLYKKI